MEIHFTLCFSTFQHHWAGHPKDVSGQSRDDSSGTTFSQSALVPNLVKADQRTKLRAAKIGESVIPTRNSKTTQIKENETGGIPFIRECLISAGLPRQAADIIMQSWRPSTRKQYGLYYQRWVQFCQQQQIDKINPSLGEIMFFLTRLYDDGLGYSAINTAKSMLSALFQIIPKRVYWSWNINSALYEGNFS